MLSNPFVIYRWTAVLAACLLKPTGENVNG